MVTMNISTEVDLANRTQGVINDIVLDYRDHLGKKEIESGNITLVYPSAMIVFQPVEATFPRFNSFKDGKIPLFPSEYTFKITTSTSPKKIISCQQYNLTASYAFTLVKCGKITEVTLGIPDVKSRPMRYWKGLWLQLMCCAPFRLLS